MRLREAVRGLYAGYAIRGHRCFGFCDSLKPRRSLTGPKACYGSVARVNASNAQRGVTRRCVIIVTLVTALVTYHGSVTSNERERTVTSPLSVRPVELGRVPGRGPGLLSLSLPLPLPLPLPSSFRPTGCLVGRRFKF